METLTNGQIEEIAAMFPHAEYQPTLSPDEVDPCKFCKGTIDDHKANCVVPHVHALCATVKQLQEERDGILKNMIEMNQIRALDKTAWRRVGETLGLAEEESSHTSHVLATLAGRVTKYEQLQSQLEQLRAENEKLKTQLKSSLEIRQRDMDLAEKIIDELRNNRRSYDPTN